MNNISETTEHEVHFIYRSHKDYQDGVQRDISSKVHVHPIKLFNAFLHFYRIDQNIASKRFGQVLKIPYLLLQISQLPSLCSALRIFFLLKKLQPDLVHVNNGGYPASAICQTAIFAAIVAKIRGLVYHINNPAQRRISFFDKRFDKFLGKHVSCFTAASQQTIRSLEEHCKFPSEKIEQIYNTIETPIIKHTREEILKLYVLPEDIFVLCEVAFLDKRKGQTYILEGLKIIKSERPEIFEKIVLFLVGEGSTVHELKSYCDHHGLKNVIFAGYQSNYADYINAADLFLLPSIGGEDMPLVILVAMYLKKAIISTPVAGILEEIEHGVSGRLVAIENLGQLNKDIIEFFESSTMRTSYGEQACARFLKHFSQHTVFAKFKNMYQRILSNE